MSSQLNRRTKAAVVSDFRRAEILEAARRTFARRGLTDTTVDEIAKAARVAKGTVYLYYRSKEELLKHALAEGLAALRDASVPVIEASPDVEDSVRRFLRVTLEYFDRNREFLELVHFEAGVELRKRAKRTFGQVYTAQVRAWRAALARAVRDHRIAPLDARHGALIIVSLAHGLAIQRLKGWTRRPLEDDVALASTILMKGLLPR